MGIWQLAMLDHTNIPSSKVQLMELDFFLDKKAIRTDARIEVNPLGMISRRVGLHSTNLIYHSAGQILKVIKWYM